MVLQGPLYCYIALNLDVYMNKKSTYSTKIMNSEYSLLIKGIEKLTKEVGSSKEKSRNLLVRAGIFNKN